MVDTSVVLKWYASEENSDKAETLLGQELIAPELISAELGNALWKKVRLGQISDRQAHDAFPHLADYVNFVSTYPLAAPALGIALELEHPIYDCFFLALAEQSGAELVTADKRFSLSCRGTRFEDRVRLL